MYIVNVIYKIGKGDKEDGMLTINRGIHGIIRVLDDLVNMLVEKGMIHPKNQDVEDMERYNIQNIMRIIGNDPEHKVQRLLDYTNRPRDIADPWYTGNFDETFDDVMEGCQAFLSYLMEHLQ